MAEQIPRVRDLDPTSVLGRRPPGGDLQPYLPREVDTGLDHALARPGLVVISFESGAGARRSAYEALLRNLPDARFYTPALANERMENSDHQAVLWLDFLLSGRMSGPFTVDLLRRWLAIPAHTAVLLASEEGPNQQRLRELDQFEPRLIQMSGELTKAEREAATNLSDVYDGVRTVEELSSLVDAPPTVEGPTGLPQSAGYRADTNDGPDLLGITADVQMLADLVASRLVTPPLSIGLFGNWGSGKSFFMRQMRQRVDLLAHLAGHAEEHENRRGLGVSSYCASIRQIDFNAWHYVEANLWASLATHIFDELAAGTTDAELARLDQKRTSDSLLEQLSAVRVKRRLVAARGAPLKLSGEDLAWVAQEVGVSTATTDDVVSFARHARGVGAKARLLAKNMGTWVSLGVGAALAVGLAFLVQSAVWPVLLGAVPVIAVTTPVLARIQRIRDAAETRTNQQLAELDAEADRLERAIAELAPGHDVTAFARSRHVDYQQHLGVVSMLRKDLETFANLLATDPDGPERVVLYIDDLDRCPPEVVIKVLEAVHLLVALPVFVVVVGVDPRWLHQAIRHHYATVLPDAEITPTDYLEKIFQIPFQLSPMDARGFSGLVQDLVREDQPLGLVEVSDEVVEYEARTVAPAEAPPATAPLRPRQLSITQEEVDFLATLADLVPSPRAAKRLTNLYRLVRARLLDREVDEFVASGEYKAVLGLLVGAGKPDETRQKWEPLVRRFSFGHANGPRPETGGRSSVH